LNATTPVTGFDNSVSDIIFSADGSRLTVALKGVSPKVLGGSTAGLPQGYLATWDVSPVDGSLSTSFAKAYPAPGGLSPFSLTLIPGTDAILNTDPITGYSIFDFANSPNNVAAAKLTSVPQQVAICWSVRSAKTGNYYLIDSFTDKVVELHIDAQTLTGTVVQQYQQQKFGLILDTDIAPINGNE
jgi:hypothetical protein